MVNRNCLLCSKQFLNKVQGTSFIRPFHCHILLRKKIDTKKCNKTRMIGQNIHTSQTYHGETELSEERGQHLDKCASYEGRHTPVMVREILERLQPQSGQTIVDMTFGGGGHTRAIFETAPSCVVFGLDRDPYAHDAAKEYAKTNSNFIPLHGRFSTLHKVGAEFGLHKSSVDGIIFDIGASSMQFDEAERGFSLSKDGPLDMRMDKDPTIPSAADVVNRMSEAGLQQILKKYGEEKKHKQIARAITDARYAFGRITRTKQLADIVATVYKEAPSYDKLQRYSHPATKTFQALRIFVNNELNELHNGLEIAHQMLRPGGVCIALSFHSLEDRIIKRHFHGIDMDEKRNLTISAKTRSDRPVPKDEILNLTRNRWEPLSRKALETGPEEEELNPRARSAKLRAARKI